MVTSTHLVEDEHLAAPDERPSQSDELPLSLAEIATTRGDLEIKRHPLGCHRALRGVPHLAETG